MARFRNTNPVQGDGIPQLVGKICQLLGGSPTNADGIPALLRKILTAINGVAGSDNLPKRYVANLTQAGAAAPVATVLENSLGGTLVWSRNSAGAYAGTLAGAFPDAEKVVALCGPLGTNEALDFSVSEPDQIVIVVTSAGVESDDMLLRESIVIEVYP